MGTVISQAQRNQWSVLPKHRQHIANNIAKHLQQNMNISFPQNSNKLSANVLNVEIAKCFSRKQMIDIILQN